MSVAGRNLTRRPGAWSPARTITAVADLISWRRIREDFKELYDRALAGDDRDLPEVSSF